mmetsp:Transcript_43776/g.103035  ORF Transcript_43776/g.103035 Transcript_43776/m.103035 type:complete len:357 (-) Transcript_43776:145-1215(-)
MRWLPWKGKKKELDEKNRERGFNPGAGKKDEKETRTSSSGASSNKEPAPSGVKKQPEKKAARPDALLTPCYRGDVDKVAELLATKADTTVCDALGNSPLHLAAFNGHVEVMKLLLDAGANPNVENGEKDTPLYMAVLSNKIECVKLMAEKDIQFNCSNVEGFAPLHYSAGEGNLAISEYLVEACGADPVAPDNLGLTPSFCAVLQGRHDVTQYLLQIAPETVLMRNMASDTMLHCALKAQHVDKELVRLLLRFHSDLASVGADKMTCEQMMAARHMEDLVEYGKTVAGGGGGSAQPGGEAQPAKPDPPPAAQVPAQIPWMKKYLSGYIESHGASEMPSKPAFSDPDLQDEWMHGKN